VVGEGRGGGETVNQGEKVRKTEKRNNERKKRTKFASF
jgi:hypothetical protein